MLGELHAQIELVQRNLRLSTQAGLPYEASLHRARLQDLIEIGARHGIDATAWVDRALLASPALTDG